MIPSKIQKIERENEKNEKDISKIIQIQLDAHSDYFHKKLIKIPILDNVDILESGGIFG